MLSKATEHRSRIRHLPATAMVIAIVGAVTGAVHGAKRWTQKRQRPGLVDSRMNVQVQEVDARPGGPLEPSVPRRASPQASSDLQTTESEPPHRSPSLPSRPSPGRALACVKGRVIDDGDGSPIANASIAVGGEVEVHSDAVGRFELSVPCVEGRAGQVTLDVRRDGGVAMLSIPVTVPPGGVSDLTVRFPSAARLRLFVSEPIQEATVRLLPRTEAHPVRRDYQVFTEYESWPEDREPRREWEVPGLVSGTYDVLVTSRTAVARGQVELRPGETVLCLPIEQYSRLSVRGAVGRAIAVTCLDPLEPDAGRATWSRSSVGSEGEEDWDVSPGRWLLTVLPKDRTLAAVRREVQLIAGAQSDIEVDFPPGRMVDVVVPRGLDGCSLVVWGPPGCWVSRTADATLQIGGLGAGDEAWIEARGREYGYLRVPESARTAELELGPPAQLEILALGSDGRACHGTLVNLWDAHGDRQWATSLTADRFRMGSVIALQGILVMSGDHGLTGPDGRVTFEALRPGPRRIGHDGRVVATLELHPGGRQTCTVVLPDR